MSISSFTNGRHNPIVADKNGFENGSGKAQPSQQSIRQLQIQQP
jgi:hypothetical protein